MLFSANEIRWIIPFIVFGGVDGEPLVRCHIFQRDVCSAHNTETAVEVLTNFDKNKNKNDVSFSKHVTVWFWQRWVS